MAAIFDNLQSRYRLGSSLIKLIFINVGVFLLLRLTSVLLMLFNVDSMPLLHTVQMPSSPLLLLSRPWTLVTYMFVHYDLLHILFNMLWLYWFGEIFLRYFSDKQLVGLYLLGGLGGALLYFLSYNLFPYFEGMARNSWLMGASASVLAIVVAMAFYIPDYKINLLFLGAVSLKYIALFTVVLDLLSITSSNAGGHIAHLGGALVGYWFVARLKRGKDLTSSVNRLLDKLVTLFKAKPRMRVKVNEHYRRPETDMEYRERKKKEMEEIDRILDKVRKSGYEHLSAEEKKRLFDAGNK